MLLAALGALAIGLSLGLLGSGGSILTVPVLVYLLGQEEKVAIAGSLFVVGTIAAAGAAQYAWRGRVAWRAALAFGMPAMAGSWVGARLGGFVDGGVQLAVFGGVMLVAAALMFRATGAPSPEPTRRRPWKEVLDGIGVGLLTGFVGVGGGFLIVPALVLLGGLEMAAAVGTSLVVIAASAFTGLAKHLDVLAERGATVDWPVLCFMAALGITGSVAGRRVGQRLSQAKLRRALAIFVVVVALAILWQSLPATLAGNEWRPS